MAPSIDSREDLNLPAERQNNLTSRTPGICRRRGVLAALTGGLPAPRRRPRQPGGAASLNAGLRPVPGGLSFRRIIDIPVETCLAAFDSWQRTAHDGALHIGQSLLRGPVEHDPDFGTYRIEVRLARGSLRPPLRMRLDIGRWSTSPPRTALELIPCTRIRPTDTYFRAGHLLLDALTRSLPPHLPAQRPGRITAPQPHPHHNRPDQASRPPDPHLRPAPYPDLPHPARRTDTPSATHAGPGSQ